MTRCLKVVALVVLSLLFTSLASAVPINPGAADYSWDFEDGSGTTVTALTGGINGILETGATFATQATPVTGASNRVVSLDGSTGNVNFGANSAFEFVNSTFTIAFWVNTPATAARTMLVTKGNGSSPHGNDPNSWAYQMELLMTSSALAGAPLTASNNSRFERESTSSNLDDGTWHHVAAILNTSTATGEVQLYIDGVERITTIAQDNFADNAAYNGAPLVPLRLGVRSTGASGVELPMAGFFDEFALFDRGLTSDEIEWLATNSLTPPPVPEPASCTLLVGCLLVSLTRKNRNRRKNHSTFA
jgi:hypothetical protein